jgi:hypothetical protein
MAWALKSFPVEEKEKGEREEGWVSDWLLTVGKVRGVGVVGQVHYVYIFARS